MAILYLDIFSGISGDMFLGALLDLGVDFDQLQEHLKQLGLEGYHLESRKINRDHIQGTQFEVHLDTLSTSLSSKPEHGHDHGCDHDHDHGCDHDHDHQSAREPVGSVPPHKHHSFAQICNLIRTSSLSDWVKQQAIAVFERIAVAEGKIHGCPTDDVHFHEVGAIDSIIDIVGACVALEMLDKPQVFAGPVIEGTGWIQCAHGRFPIPAPATIAILGNRGVPISQCEETVELVTPTGAALLAQLVEQFGLMNNMVATRVGYGFGSRETQTRPNVLRAILSQVSDSAHDWQSDQISVLETNLDDVSPEVVGHFVDLALSQGALDVFHTPIHMKKNRPGVLLTVICQTSDTDRLTELILVETSAFGVRRRTSERRKLVREFTQVQTPFGILKIKLGKLDGQVVHASPEFESCKELALKAGVPLKQIYEFANEFYHQDTQYD